ncbi:Uncharacterised protein [Shigella sonnei]|nr:Uncharacterised protein [Shigella sonnei]
MSSALAGIRKSPAAPLLPGHAGHGLVGFQLCGLSVVCGLCRASILAGLAGMQGYASPLRSPGPSFPSAVIFRSFTRSDFAVSPSNSRQPCASGCGFPCARATLEAHGMSVGNESPPAPPETMPDIQTRELVMLIKRLASSLKAVKPDSCVVREAQDWLRDRKLVDITDILR